MSSGDTVCHNCRDDCPDPTYRQHRIDEPNVCAACGCRDFEPESPE